MKSKLWPSSEVKVLCQNRPFKNYAFCKFDSILRYAIRAPDEGGARGTMAPPLFLKLYFAEDVFLKICFRVILHDIQSLIGSGSPKILSGAWQYKFGITIEIKQLKKLNKFKKRPSELDRSNQKLTLPILFFKTWKQYSKKFFLAMTAFLDMAN